VLIKKAVSLEKEATKMTNNMTPFGLVLAFFIVWLQAVKSFHKERAKVRDFWKIAKENQSHPLLFITFPYC